MKNLFNGEAAQSSGIFNPLQLVQIDLMCIGFLSDNEHQIQISNKLKMQLNRFHILLFKLL